MRGPLWIRTTVGQQGWTGWLGIALLGLSFAAVGVALAVVDTALLRPVPAANLDDVAIVKELDRTTQQALPRVSAQTVRAMEAVLGTDSVAAVQFGNAAVVLDGMAASVRLARVSPSFFGLLSVRAAEGRMPGRTSSGTDEVVITPTLWRRLGGAEDFEPRAVTLDGRVVSVVGLVPDGFRYPVGRDLWLLQDDAALDLLPADARMLLALAKVAPDTRTVVEAVVNERHGSPSYRGAAGHWRVTLSSLRDDLVGPIVRQVAAVTMVAFAVLAIVVVNLVSLWVAAFDRRREGRAVMLALGAPPRRIIACTAAGTALFSAFAACAGTLPAGWALQEVARTWPSALGAVRMSGLQAVGIPMVAIAVAVGAVCGLFVSREVSDARVQETLRAGRWASRPPRLARWVLVIQVAAALVLTCIGTLLVRSTWQLEAEETGFATAGVVVTHVSIPRWKYPEPAQAAAALSGMLTALRSRVPHTPVAMTTGLPIGDGNPTAPVTPSRSGQGDPEVFAFVSGVTPDYLDAMSIRLTAGRDFTQRDSATAAQVVILDANLAEWLWPGGGTRNVIGRTVDVLRGERTIVGVAQPVKYHSLADDGKLPGIYLPLAQWPQREVAVVARMQGRQDGHSLATVLRTVDLDIPVAPVSTLDAMVDESLRSRRYYSFAALSLAVIAVSALLLGLAGTVAQVLATRRRELAVRLVFGASERALAMETAASFVLPAAAGAVVGACLLQALGGLLTPYLFRVSLVDGLALAISVAVVALCVAVAVGLAVRRWSRLDPQQLLSGG